jgi:hypothetical protein
LGCGSDDSNPYLPTPIFDGLAALLDQSLLKQEEKLAGEPRLTLLETIREYALERLAARGEGAVLRDRYLAYYLALAEAAEPHVRGAEQSVWAERLEVEHDNFRAALAWAHEREALDSSSTAGAEAELRLAGALFWFWAIRGCFREGQRWLDSALAQTKGLGQRKARAKALFGAGALASFQGDIAAARSRLEESAALWREVGDKRWLALTLTYGGGLGWVTLFERRLEVAHALFAEGATIWRELNDKWGLAFSLWGLGAAVRRDDPAAAHPILEESVALFREVGDKKGLANVLNQLGTVTWSQGDLAQAIVHYAEGLAIGRELGDKILIAMTLSGLGMWRCIRASTSEQLRCTRRVWFCRGKRASRASLALSRGISRSRRSSRAAGVRCATLERY